MSKAINLLYTPLVDQFKKYLEFRGITEYASVGITDSALCASVDTDKTTHEMMFYFSGVVSTSMTDSGNSFVVRLNLADLDKWFCGDFRFYNPDDLIPEKFNGVRDAMENLYVKSLLYRFKEYCLRLGFTPMDIKISTTSLMVRTHEYANFRESFSGYTSDGNGDFWLRLEYEDVHNKAIIEHNPNTKNWFDGYKIPQFHS